MNYHSIVLVDQNQQKEIFHPKINEFADYDYFQIPA